MTVEKLIERLIMRRNGYVRARMRSGERGDGNAYHAAEMLEEEYNVAIAIVQMELEDEQKESLDV